MEGSEIPNKPGFLKSAEEKLSENLKNRRQLEPRQIVEEPESNKKLREAIESFNRHETIQPQSTTMSPEVVSEESRYTKLKNAVKAAISLGINDEGRRREAVINASSAQKKNILKTSDEQKITPEQAQSIPSVANPNIDLEDPEVIARAEDKYFEVKVGNSPVVVEALHWVSKNGEGGETFTREIAEEVSRRTDSSLLLARNSRLRTDANRGWWVRDKDKEVKEYSRSARASLYWSLKRIVNQTNTIENGELKDNFFRISIHGMKDNQNYDVAIAASYSPADKEFLDLFSQTLSKNYPGIKVVLARGNDELTKDYSGLPSTKHFREKPSEDKDFHHPAFGHKFHTIQLEISRDIRINQEKREKIIDALAKTINETKKYGKQ